MDTRVPTTSNFIKEKIISPLIDKPSVGVGTNETASSYLTSLMDGKNVFSYSGFISENEIEKDK